MFAFHYHCDMLFRGSGGNSDSMYLRGCNATLFFSFYFILFYFFYLSSFSLKQRMQLLESHIGFFFPSQNKSLTYEECTFLYLCIPSAASQGLCLISLFAIAVQNIRFRKKREGRKKRKKHLPSHFLKNLCTVYRYI